MQTIQPTLREICQILETFAPLDLQESYDNSGLLIGEKENLVRGALLCLDVTEAIIDEAITLDINLIIAHHPLIFKGLKRITGRNYVERCVLKAIRHNIAIYAGHTNFDSIQGGVSYRMAEKLNLQNVSTLLPHPEKLCKLVTFVPNAEAENIKKTLFEAGAGHIGAYDCCSFSVDGAGTFRANSGAVPFCGIPGEQHTEAEQRIEVILPRYLQYKITQALCEAHPYEEPAFDIIPLANTWQQVGLGVVGHLPASVSEIDFLQSLKSIFGCQAIKHSPFRDKPISRVALCGGSGADLIPQALASKADIFITADVSYHRFFESENQLIIADIGHYESEQFTKELFYEQLNKKLPNFAIHLSTAEKRQVLVL